MSPWEVLGWLLVFVVSVYILVRLAIVVLTFAGEEWPKIKASRRRKRADKGKVTCEKIEWEGLGTDRVKVVCPEVATWRGGYRYSAYYCDEHSLRDRNNRAPLAFTERGQAMRRDAPVVVRSPQTRSISPGTREDR